MTTSSEQLERAKISLTGLSVGDALGGYFFVRSPEISARITERILPACPWNFSDDTMMALSIFSILRQYGGIDRDQLARNFAAHYEPSRGYGPSVRRLMLKIREGEAWASAAGSVFAGQGSYGNGGAMRVAPLGAYFADDLDVVIQQAEYSAEVTHAHPEGIAGAIAVAVAAAIATQYRVENMRPSGSDFISQVSALVPASEVKTMLRRAASLPTSTPIRDVTRTLGNGENITAQDTVPFTLWCAAQHLESYEDAIWLTITGGGDVDTNCAIVGGIVAAFTGIEGIPETWITCRESLHDWAFVE